MSTLTPGSYALCQRSDLDSGATLEFRLGEGDWPLRLFVFEYEGTLYAYRNVCPHAGTPLNWKPDEFLTADRSLIMCRSHGALFSLEDGLCIAGPCAGRSLQALPVTQNQRAQVVVEIDTETAATSR